MAVSQVELKTTRRLTSSSAENQSPFVFLLRKGGTKTPLYFISAGADEPRLANLMGDDRPIYGTQIAWPADWLEAARSHDVSSIPNLEEFAGLFVEELHKHLGSSPCILAGHSFGSVIAFEVGRQFQMRAGKVEAVVIIDRAAHMEETHDFVMRNLRQCWSGTPSDPRGSFRGRIDRFALTARWLLGKAKTRTTWAVSPARGELITAFDAGGASIHWPMLMRFYEEMHRNYRPAPLNCRGIVIRAANARYESIRPPDKQMGWGGLFTEGLVALEFTDIAHNAIIREHAQSLASAIREAIAAY